MQKNITLLGIYLFVLLSPQTPIQSASLCDAYICYQVRPNDFANKSTLQLCASGQKVVRQNQDDSTDQYMLKVSQSCKNTGQNIHNYCSYQQITNAYESTSCYNKQFTGSMYKRPPGEPCTTNDQCYGEERCQNNVCFGSSEGQACSQNLDCAVELYCKDNRICNRLLEDGQACQSNDYCVNNAKCNSGKCTKFFSLSNDETVTNNDPRMCRSGYMENGVCKAGLKSKNRGRIGEKPESQVCAYLEADGTDSSTKQDSKCGYAMIPSAYCPLGAGDDEFIRVLNQVTQLILRLSCCCQALALVDNGDLNKCHIDNPFGCSQLMTSANMLSVSSFTNIMTLRDSYTQVQDAPACVNWNLNFDLLYIMQGAYPTTPVDIIQSNVVDESMLKFEKVIE